MARAAALMIGKQLQAVRIQRGLSVSEAARVLGVRRQMVYNYENGKSLPSLEVLVAGANEWNVSFELEGCKVVPEEAKDRRPKPPQPTQMELVFKKPKVYRGASVRIRQRDHEMVITAVVRTGRYAGT
jgi:transcriptional regulator with XRE-family HTH domain